jgi:small subunit ribosomal protein S17
MQTKTVKKQTLQGVVVSNKMQKTVVVDVSRFVKHPKYGKYYTINKNIKAHAEDKFEHNLLIHFWDQN